MSSGLTEEPSKEPGDDDSLDVVGRCSSDVEQRERKVRDQAITRIALRQLHILRSLNTTY